MKYYRYVRYLIMGISACGFAYCFVSSYTLAFTYYDKENALYYMLIGSICLILYFFFFVKKVRHDKAFINK